MAQAIEIERINVNVSSSGQTYTLDNDVGDMSKAFIRMTGATDKSSGGPVGNTRNVSPNKTFVGYQLTSTDTVTFYLGNDSSSRKVMLEVWRYVGIENSPYEFKVRQRGSLSVSSSDSSASGSVTGLDDRNKAIPIVNGCTTDINIVTNFNGAVFGCHVDSDNNIVVSKNNLDGTGATVYYEVVEFTGERWNVGHGISLDHDNPLADTVTLNEDSTGTGGAVFDVSDWSTAMILEATMEGDSSETGLADVIATVYPAVDTTQVNFSVKEAHILARNDGSGYIHVLQCDDLVVHRDNGSINEGNNSYGTALSLPSGVNEETSLQHLSLEWFVSTSGTGTAHARGRLVASIEDNSGYEIVHWVHRSGNDVIANYGVVDLSNLESFSYRNKVRFRNVKVRNVKIRTTSVEDYIEQ